MAKYSDGLDGVAAALAHPGRRQVVDRLRAGSATTSQLAELLGIGLPATGKHLGVLGTSSLVRSTKTGRVVRHELDPTGLSDMAGYSTWLLTRRSFWAGRLDDLTTYLEAE